MLKVLKLRIYKKFNNKVHIKNYLGKAETIYVVGKYSLGLPLIYHYLGKAETYKKFNNKVCLYIIFLFFLRSMI
jgi:hypothetical protein